MPLEPIVGRADKKPSEANSISWRPQAGVFASVYSIGRSRCLEISLDQEQRCVKCGSAEIYLCTVWPSTVTVPVRRDTAATPGKPKRKVPKRNRRDQKEPVVDDVITDGEPKKGCAS